LHFLLHARHCELGIPEAGILVRRDDPLTRCSEILALDTDELPIWRRTCHSLKSGVTYTSISVRFVAITSA
jgi:hypothetical protein